jgi:hypothetical protein
VDVDVVRILDAFRSELARLPDRAAPRALIERTEASLHAALTSAAGLADDGAWRRLHHDACRLIAAVADTTALPGLRAFVAENADLDDEVAALVHA